MWLSPCFSTLHHIQVELASQHYIIGITTIADELKEIEEFMQAIELVFEEYLIKTQSNKDSLIDIKSIISNPTTFIENQRNKSSITELIKAKQVFTIYETSLKNAKSVLLKDSIGKVATEFIIPYPPGIPLVVPGEEISLEIAEYIEYLLGNKMEVYGIIKGVIRVVE